MVWLVNMVNKLGVWFRKRLCNILFYVDNFDLFRMILNLTLRFDFNCLEYWLIEKLKFCNGFVKKKIVD